MIRLCAFADEYSNNLDEQIDALHKNKINLIELRNVDGVNVTDLTEQQAENTFKRLQKAEIAVWSVGSALGKVDIDMNCKKYLEKVESVCRNANILGANRIRIFSFFNAYEKRAKVIDLLSKMVEIAEKYGVKLCHENEKEIYGDTVERVLDIHRSVKGLSLVYDPANFVQCGQNVDYALEKLYSVTEYFHCKDVIAATGELVPAGEGDGGIEKLFNMIDRDTVITVEPHLAVFEGYAAIDGTHMKNKYNFDSNKEAFNAGITAVKETLQKCGYVADDSNNYCKRS